MAITTSAASSAALEATKKAGACWVDLGSGPQLVWHAWLDDALLLVCGGQEQELLRSSEATGGRVTVRTRDGRVLTWGGTVEELRPDVPDWAPAAAALHEKRCNAPDGEQQPTRWASDSTLLRISPEP